MLCMNEKSHVICHVLILRIFGALKKLHFQQNHKDLLNRLNSANWAELHKSHMQGSQGEVTCREHASCPKWTAFTNGWSCNSADSLSQYRYQLIVRLKANKCYHELLRYLSSSINLLVSDLCSGFWPLYRCYWWWNHPLIFLDYINDNIALIALNLLLIILFWLLWPYHWFYHFDYIILAVSLITFILIILFGQSFALFHLKVRAV